MSAEPAPPEEVRASPEAEAARAHKLALIRRRRARRRIGTAGFVGVLLLLVLTGVAVRLAVLTDPGRAAVSRLLEGREVGRFGRLHVEGLTGDVFGDFGFARVAVIDAKGAWLDARNVSLHWSPHELVARRFHAETLSAAELTVLRRPELSAAEPGGGGLPVDLYLDDVRLHLRTRPAFSVQEGLWDVTARAEILRGGRLDGRLDAQSRLHAGDGVAALFRVGDEGLMDVRIDAVEGRGGALAGALGLPADQRFLVHGRMNGAPDRTGELTLVAESGRRRPLSAEGSWGPGGARLQARVELDASRLTAPYAVRAGPEVRASLTAAPGEGDVFRIDARLQARDASLSVKGPVDWRKRRTEGLAVQARLAEFHRWTGVLNGGETEADGTVKGSVDAWRFEGRARMRRISQWGYRLDTAAGPAEIAHAKGEFRLKAELATAGGSGEGLLPVLLGASPKIELDGSRLRGGRLLIRDLKVDGPGFALAATGERSIFGVLSLKGEATLSRFERAHQGATGVVRAAWTARQQGHDPWRISADARAEGFATGYPEADRLLGAAPTLTLQGRYRDGLEIAEAELTGAASKASFRGTVDTSAMVALDTDWRAHGPFPAGPFEVAGEAMGTGRLTGRALAPHVELSAVLASVDFGRLAVRPARMTLALDTEGQWNGRIGVTGPSDWGPARMAAGFEFLPDGIALSDISADAGGGRLTGDLALRSGAPSSADLDFVVGPGAFLTEGHLTGRMKIVDRPGGASADIAVDGERLLAPGMLAGLRSLKLRAAGPFSRLPFQVSASGAEPLAWRFAGDGTFAQSGDGAAVSRAVSLTGTGRLRQAEVRTLEPIRARFSPGGVADFRLRLGVGPGHADIDARQVGEALDAKAEVVGVELASFAAAYTGRFTGSLSLSGRGERLDGTLDAAIDGGRDRDAPADEALSAKVRAVLADTRVRVDASATNPQGLEARLALDVPAEAAARPFRIALVRDQPLNGSFDAEGELRPLWDLFAGGARTLSGRGQVDAKLGGTLNSLQPTGTAAVDGGRFQDAGTGLDLRNLAVQVVFDRQQINMRRFSGDDGHGGQVSGSGEISLRPDGVSTFTADLKGFQLIDNQLARASASGQVTVTGDASGRARLSGALVVDHAEITANPPVPTGVTPLEVVEVNRPGSDEDEPVRRGPGGPRIAVDVDIDARRGVFIRGNGLDIELSLDAHVGGTTAAPELTGQARVVRGDYQFAGKRFEFDERGVIRLASHPEQVRLDLTATREDPTLRAMVQIQGTAARPEITLSSVPVLPQDEVLSQVLFGRSASQLSPLEAAQLASAVTGLATGGGFDVLGNLRQFARLDRLAVSGGGDGAATTVSGGKYLTDDVYLELTGGGRQGPTVQVEWRVRRNLSVVSTVGTQGDARLSVRLRRNY